MVRAGIRAHDVGVIMHFAGSVVVPELASDSSKYYRNNTAASRALLECAVRCDVGHFIFSSTAATYDIPDHVPVREDASKRPINPYCVSKLMTESMLADLARRASDRLLRAALFQRGGCRSGRPVGAIDGRREAFKKVAVEAATGKRDGVSVFGTDFAKTDGTGARDYIHVSDLAAAHVDSLRLLIERPERSRTLNCGYGCGYSVLEVLGAVDRVTNVRVERRLEARRAGDPDALVANNSAILEAVPWRPRL